MSAVQTEDTFCDASWITLSSEDGRTCSRCGWKISGAELRQKGTIPALEERARACKLAEAIAVARVRRE